MTAYQAPCGLEKAISEKSIGFSLINWGYRMSELDGIIYKHNRLLY